MALEDSSPIMGIVMVPVFSDVDLRQWISWMEHYFTRKGLTDFEKLHMAFGFIVGEAERYIYHIDSLMPIRSWKDMKETLLLKFGDDDDPEKIRLQIDLDRCHDYVMNWKPQRRSETIQAKSSEYYELVIPPDIEVEKHTATVEDVSIVSVAGIVHQKKSSHVPVHETKAILKKSLAQTDHEIKLQSENGSVLSCLAEEVHPKQNSTLSKELVPELKLVTKSSLLEESEEKLVAEVSMKGSDMGKKVTLARLDKVFVSFDDCFIKNQEAKIPKVSSLTPFSAEKHAENSCCVECMEEYQICDNKTMKELQKIEPPILEGSLKKPGAENVILIQ